MFTHYLHSEDKVRVESDGLDGVFVEQPDSKDAQSDDTEHNVDSNFHNTPLTALALLGLHCLQHTESHGDLVENVLLGVSACNTFTVLVHIVQSFKAVLTAARKLSTSTGALLCSFFIHVRITLRLPSHSNFLLR